MARCSIRVLFGCLMAFSFLEGGVPVYAQPGGAPDPANANNEDDSVPPAAKKPIEMPGLKRISKDDEVWIHPMRNYVVVNGEVVLRRGVLELLACPKGTKDYESIIAVNSKAWVVHTALMAVGAQPGSPVHFNPDTLEVTPAHGPIIDIRILWRDENGKIQNTKAQEWIRHIKSQKAMEHDWVFGGSHLVKHPETGEFIYQADGTGELICVSNFATATMDLPIRSSADAADLLFEPFTERIPEQGTPVRLVLKPRVDEQEDDAQEDDAQEDKEQTSENAPEEGADTLKE